MSIIVQIKGKENVALKDRDFEETTVNKASMHQVELQVEKLESYATEVHSKLQALCHRNDVLRSQRDGAQEDAARYQKLLEESIATAESKELGWRRERAELCSKLAKLQAELDHKEAIYRESAGKQEAEDKTVAAERQRLQASHEAAMKAAGIRISQLEVQVKKLEKFLHSEKKENEHLNVVILDLENQLSAVENALSRKEVEQNERNKQIANLELEKSDLEEKLRHALSDVEAREWRIEDLKTQVGDLIEFEKANAESMHAQMMEMASQSVADIEEGLRAFRALDVEVEKLKVVNGQAKGQLQPTEKEMMQKTTKHNRGGVSMNKSRKDDMNKAVLRELQTRLVDSEARASNAQQKVLELETEISMLRTLVESNHSAFKDSNKEAKEEQACYDIFTSLSLPVIGDATVEYALEETSASSGHHRASPASDRCETAVQTDHEENELTARLIFAEACIKEAENNAKSLREKIEALENEVEVWKRQAEDHKENHTLSLVQIEALKQECCNYRQCEEQSKNSLASLEQRLAAEQQQARQGMEGMRSRLEAAEAVATQARCDAQSLNDQMAQKSREAEQLRKERDALMEAIQELQNTCEHMASLEAGNLESAQRVEALETIVKEKNTEVEQLSKKLQEAQSKISATENFLQQLTVSKHEQERHPISVTSRLPEEKIGKENIVKSKDPFSKQQRRPGILKQQPRNMNTAHPNLDNRTVAFLR
jgi:chromosome segregation ATPase